MSRMNKSVVLALLVFASTVFLMFQLYYYRLYISKHVPHSFTDKWHHFGANAQLVVRKFLQLTHKCNLPVFVADTAVLELIQSQQAANRSQPPSCSFFCLNKDFITFGTLANLWNHEHLAEASAEFGLELLEVRGKDPRLAALDQLSAVEIPLHVFFRWGGRVIHLVVFYERSGNYLWHGALRLKPGTDKLFVPFRKMEYGQRAGAFDRPELRLVSVDGFDVWVPGNISHFLAERAKAWFLECRHNDARNFYQLYPDDMSLEATDFRMKAKSVLILAARVLADLHVPFWLSSGTCLGWFRQCNIISHSKDVDLGIWIKDYKPEIIKAFQRAGLPLKHKFGKEDDSLELSFQGTSVKLDIFFFYEDGDVVWNGGTQAKTGRKFKYVFPRFTLCWAELLELKVHIPCETQDYVETNYGPYWNIPIRMWDWKSSPFNVHENGVWLSAEWDRVIQVF